MSCCTIFHLCHDFASLIPWLYFAFLPSCPEGISHRRGIDPERLPGIPHCQMYLCGQAFLSAVKSIGGKRARKRPPKALGLIYLTCHGQDPPKWGNMLTSLPGACLVFSPLCTSSQSYLLDIRQETQSLTFKLFFCLLVFPNRVQNFHSIIVFCFF